MGVKGERWCALDARWGWSKALILGAVAFWGACAGDTVSSIAQSFMVTLADLYTHLPVC